MSKANVAIVLLACGVACGGPPPPAPSPSPRPPAASSTPDVPDASLVSLVQLLANAGEFDGKRVTVSGWGNIEFEGDALYLHEVDFQHLVFANAVRLSIPGAIRTPVRDQRGYMGVVGTFHAASPTARGLPYRGSIDVELVERLPTREELSRGTVNDGKRP